jgi:hypothetical protein
MHRQHEMWQCIQLELWGSLFPPAVVETVLRRRAQNELIRLEPLIRANWER